VTSFVTSITVSVIVQRSHLAAVCFSHAVDPFQDHFMMHPLDSNACKNLFPLWGLLLLFCHLHLTHTLASSTETDDIKLKLGHA